VVTARSDALQALADERFDVAVIGGARFHAEARAAEIVAGASSGRARVA
jgi:hypothetical protein